MPTTQAAWQTNQRRQELRARWAWTRRLAAQAQQQQQQQQQQQRILRDVKFRRHLGSARRSPAPPSSPRTCLRSLLPSQPRFPLALLDTARGVCVTPRW